MAYTQEIKDEIRNLLIKYPNANIVKYGYKTKNGIRTGEKSIVFGFDEKKPLSELNESEIIPNSVNIKNEDIVTDVIVEQKPQPLYEFCPSSFYTWQNTTPPQRNFQRPLKGGLEISNQSSSSLSGGIIIGTMGFIAVDNETNSLVGVTNNHVAIAPPRTGFIANEPNRAVDNCLGNNVSQDASYSSSKRIGKVKRYKPIYGNVNNYTDGALISLKESEVNLNESYKFYGFESDITGPLDFATTAEIDSLIDNNYEFYSVGRTTSAKGFGETKLLFDGYSTFPIAYSLGINENNLKYVIFADSISYIASASTTTPGDVCYSPIEGGDSGSGLLVNINGTIKIVGLSFAGAGQCDGCLKVIAHANRIDRVAEDLNISPFTGQAVNFSDIDNPLVHYEPGLSSDETKVINGKTYYQLGSLEV